MEYLENIDVASNYFISIYCISENKTKRSFYITGPFMQTLLGNITVNFNIHLHYRGFTIKANKTCSVMFQVMLHLPWSKSLRFLENVLKAWQGENNIWYHYRGETKACWEIYVI